MVDPKISFCPLDVCHTPKGCDMGLYPDMYHHFEISTHCHANLASERTGGGSDATDTQRGEGVCRVVIVGVGIGVGFNDAVEVEKPDTLVGVAAASR